MSMGEPTKMTLKNQRSTNNPVDPASLNELMIKGTKLLKHKI